MSNGTLKIGSESPDRIYIGADEVDEIYQGQDLIWTKPQIYGWHVDPTISDPYQAVTYLEDARNKESASLYRQVEYLKSTGTQIIVTDIIPTLTECYELDLKFTSSEGRTNKLFFGTWQFKNGASYTRFMCNWGTNNTDSIIGRYLFSEGAFTTLPTTAKTNRNTLSLFGQTGTYGATTLENVSVTYPTDIDLPLALFGIIYGETIQDVLPYSDSSMIIYGFKVYDNNHVLVHNLLPVERGDGELGLFDTVTGKFYANAGTGTFEKGSYVDNQVFGYGDWEDAFFMPKPCMLKSDGTVAYYLDPDDYTKKADGTASDVANAFFDGNAMMEWPIIWYKFESLEDKGYRAIEYLKSTGTQCILTDIVPNVTYKTEVEIKLDTFLAYMTYGNNMLIGSSGYGVQFGTNTDANYITFLLGHGWATPVDYQIKNPPNFNTKGLLTVCRGVNASSWNSTKISVTKPVTVTPSNPIVIFGYNGGTIQPYKCYEVRIYSVKMYDGANNLIHNLIPVERISDNELGLYDVATNKFYGNAGTGTFAKGSYVDGHGFFYCSPVKVDSSYTCWCNINANDEIIPHFYTAIYNGTGTAKLRSLSGVQLTSANGSGDTTVSVDVSKAAANGTGWYIETLSVRSLINSLLILIGKDLNCSEVFGNGITGTGVQETRNNKENYYTGTCNDKGLFWGSLSSHTQPVKVFGMENWWGCVFRRVAGLLHDSDTQRYYLKLTAGRSDGTTVDGYSFTSHNGYIAWDIPVPYTSGGYIKTMRFSQYGFYPLVLSASASDNNWHSWWAIYDNGIEYSLAGGMVTGRVGTFEMDFTINAASSYTMSSCLTFRP